MKKLRIKITPKVRRLMIFAGCIAVLGIGVAVFVFLSNKNNSADVATHDTHSIHANLASIVKSVDTGTEFKSLPEEKKEEYMQKAAVTLGLDTTITPATPTKLVSQCIERGIYNLDEYASILRTQTGNLNQYRKELDAAIADIRRTCFKGYDTDGVEYIPPPHVHE